MIKFIMSVISVYTPTFRYPQEHKDQFYDDLMCTINSVSQGDVLLIVEDFNAKVESNQLDSSNAEWSSVRGNHGVGNVNEAGRTLLTLCAVNVLTVINTLYEKRDIYKYTWQHPGSKMRHCIDYVLMKQSQRNFCGGVSVIRRADCWANHKLLCAKITLRHEPLVA